MSQQQYTFKNNNGSGLGSSSNLGNASSRDNLKNLMKKQQQNLNYCDNQYIQETMNRTGLNSSSNNTQSPQNNNSYQNAYINGGQNYQALKNQGNSSQQQTSNINKMIEAYQKNRPVTSQQLQQSYQQQQPLHHQNTYSSPLRNNFNNTSVIQNQNSPSQRAITAQDSRRESNNYNNQINIDLMERKSSLGRNKIDSSFDNLNSSFGKVVSSSNNYSSQQKSPAPSTNKVQQMLKDLMGNTQNVEKTSQYQLQSSYSKSNLNKTDQNVNQISPINSNQSNQVNYSNRNEISHLRSRESSNDKNKFINQSNSNLTQNNLYNNLITSSNQLSNRLQNQVSYQNPTARQSSPSQNNQTQINSSFNQGTAYKNMASIEIQNFNSNNNINDSYSQKLLKSSNSSKNLQMIDLDSKNINKSTQNLLNKSKTQQAQQNQATLNRNGSNSKLRLQDDAIEQAYKNNRSITPKYTSQNQTLNKTQTSNQQQQRNKSPLSSSINNNNLTSQKSLNDNSYLQIVGTSSSKQPLSNNNNSSFSNVNNSSFNQTNIASSSNLKQAAQQNDLLNDLQKRRLTPTPINQNLEIFERHQSLQNIIQMQEQQQYLNQQQQSQNKSPLRTNNYFSQQSLNNNIQQNSAKENISSISNHLGKNLASTVNVNNNCNNNNYQNQGQREPSKSPNHSTNTFSQNQNQQQGPQSQIQNSKQTQQTQQFTQSLRGTSQEAKNSNQQLLTLQQKQNNLQKTKQANTPLNNNGNISGGVSQSSTSSASSQQKSTDLNKSSNSILNQKQTNQQQQQLQQQQQSQKNIQNQQIQQQGSSQNSPFFGNQQLNNNNENQHLKKINPQNQNELLKAIQEQIKLKNDKKQGQTGQQKKQRNKPSQDFLDSTYFQFNSQLIEQIQQEQTEEQKNTTQQCIPKESTNLLNNSLYLTQIKQSQQASQNNFPSFGQLQTSYEMQLQQAQLMTDNQQLQQQAHNKSKLNPQVTQQNQQIIQINKQQQMFPPQSQSELSKQPKQNQDEILLKQKSQNVVDERNQLLNQQLVKKNQQLSINEKSSLALNNDQESVDSANTTTCFSEELSKSTLAKINLTELLQIEQNLFDLQKDAFKSKKQTTKYCKNYLNSIAEQNIDNLERIGSDTKQSQILIRMFILERICVMLSLHESLNKASSNQESLNDCNEDFDEDDDCTNHIKNTLQYVHLNFFVFLDTVFSKYNFTGSTKELEQQIKKVFETRTKVKRFQNCLNKQDKFQVISNYCDIILPYLKNIVQNYDKEPYISIANILNNISIQTVSGTMSILMDCFQKIISDLGEKAAKESKSSIEDSFSDISSKQNASTEKSKNTSINSTSEKQKVSEDSNQKKKPQVEQSQNSQNEYIAAKQNSNQQEASIKQQQKDYYTQLDEDQQDDDDDEEENSEDRLVGTIPAPYLPPIDNPNKYTLVLDLDETLVHYQEIPEEGGQFLIRPHAEIFLQKLSEYYEIVIFTAALKDYADFILDVLDTTFVISHRLYRQHTDRNGRCFAKDISKLGRDLSKTLIIDNLPENFCRQPMNGILIQSWYGDPEDRALYDLIPLLIDVTQSKKYRDVRIALQKLREQTMKNLLNGINDPHLNIVLDKID
ncbi:NLI interacting factor-like phosphatase (macronuclear) [Tetrahymena thermophila SB210]|uniref:NLI interacting factor-like phosphatase n=1 Tax=Tetrahymena thermophila (strain SB210) TaxID=312017 RepID=Q23DG5_TETTS|nr:NLI interacting factor-like phosphatase [Tetrahymena thermophila SB210]EAR94394.3 NLI interacting factor-like phosphatase [Tetrahymena thermophila SB210]|eukprot:XP_001014721.3 NLI interacting factor-like phosphatase [Tetrahymena thermophila SB210]